MVTKSAQVVVAGGGRPGPARAWRSAPLPLYGRRTDGGGGGGRYKKFSLAAGGALPPRTPPKAHFTRIPS